MIAPVSRYQTALPDVLDLQGPGIATKCPHCAGDGYLPGELDPYGRKNAVGNMPCAPCGGQGFTGFDPSLPTDAVPCVPVKNHGQDARANPAKLILLQARYARGLPLWHPQDRRDFEGLCDHRRGASEASDDDLNGE